RSIRAGVGGADINFVRVGPDPSAPRNNIAIVAASARRDYQDRALLRLFVLLHNHAPESIETALSLRLDNETVGGEAVTLPPATPDGPGEYATTFELRNSSGGILRIAHTRPDDLPADNQATLVLQPARAAQIVLVTNPASPRAVLGLAEALEVAAGRSIVTLDLASYESRAAEPGALADVDLIVFDAVRPATLPPAPTLSFGAPPPLPGLIIESPAEDAEALRVTTWRRTHPILRNVGLDSLLIARAQRLAIADPAPTQSEPPSPRPTYTTLAFGPDAPLIILAERAAVRRVVVAFELAQSNWPLLLSFYVFINNIVEQLALGGEADSAYAYTSAQPVTLRPLADVDRITIEGPINRTISIPESAREISLGALPRVGLYRATGVLPRDSAFAVNLLDPIESALATADTVEISGRPAQAGAIGSAAPREIWHWFVIAATILLTLEYLLYAWRMRV
ncbi:MAG: hypothetical protein VYC34_12555, partial [Planctomycetota bacterium]|nr:hypothetical protein [Planctomycetota bacterium]